MVSYKGINPYKMKNTLFRIIFTFTLIALLNSCRKDYAKEHYSEDTPVITPDLSIKIQAGVSGFITDENDKPVFNADIVAGNKTTVTDEFGYFHIADASLPEIAGFVKAGKTGYFPGYKTFVVETGKESFVRIKLLPQNNPGDIDANAGGAVDLAGGARLSLPSDAVVLASSGTAYSGAINVSAHSIDPSNINAVQLQSPGDTRGIDDKGHLQLLNTYGILAVELTNNAGQLLQIAAGKQATITIPIPATLVASAPATIALWSFDVTNGLWKQEATATKSGNSYTGTVSHFSFWTGATGIPLVQFSARIVNAALEPVVNAAIGIRNASEPFNAGFGRFGYTDANGYVTGEIPTNRSLILNVLTPCETEAYSHPFNSTNSDVDLGVLTGNLGQGMVTISGNAVDCSNQPITNGYVQTYDNGFYNRINIVNGTFTFTGLACTNTVASYIAIDKNANQQGAPQTVSLVPGLNNLGTVTACGTSTISTISITIDGGAPVVMAEPADQFLSVFSALSGGWTTVLRLNNPTFNIQFDGLAETGSVHKVTEVFSDLFPGGRATATPPLTVNVTEYGIPGGFIAGSFSGTMLDFAAGGTHQVSCDFRVRRYQ
jgi:hypothetical protein